MSRTIYAMEPRALAEYLKIQDEVRVAHRGMSAVEMREAIAQIYASTLINGVLGGPQDGQAPYSVDGDGVAHIPVTGMLTPELSPCAGLTGPETEYSFIRGAVMAANSDPRVLSILLETDSPGGNVNGLDETAQVIAASEKPINSRVHNMAASAAYWLISQTGKIVASSPADMVGSIGVAVQITDHSEADAQEGIETIVLTSTDAPNKRPDIKTEDGKEQIVADLDALHGVFASRVAAGRGTTVANVNANYGRGGVLIAAEAMKAGMIDFVNGVSIARDNTPGVAGAAARAADKKREVKGMEYIDITLEALTKERPELVAAATEAGVKKERERQASLDRWAKADPENQKVSEIVAEAKAAGKSESDVQPQLLVAVRKHADGTDGGENPPSTTTAISTGGVSGVAALTPDDIAAAKLINMSLADYVKYSKGGK